VDEVVDIDLEVKVKLGGRMRVEFVRRRSIGEGVTSHFIFLPKVLFLAGLLRIGGVPMEAGTG
jgi:hypothetical protein